MFEFVTRGAGPVLTPGASYNKLGRGPLRDAAYLCLQLLEKEIFTELASFLPFCCHGNQNYGLNSLPLTTLVKLYVRNIHTKFH